MDLLGTVVDGQGGTATAALTLAVRRPSATQWGASIRYPDATGAPAWDRLDGAFKAAVGRNPLSYVHVYAPHPVTDLAQADAGWAQTRGLDVLLNQHADVTDIPGARAALRQLLTAARGTRLRLTYNHEDNLHPQDPAAQAKLQAALARDIWANGTHDYVICQSAAPFRKGAASPCWPLDGFTADELARIVWAPDVYNSADTTGRITSIVHQAAPALDYARQQGVERFGVCETATNNDAGADEQLVAEAMVTDYTELVSLYRPEFITWFGGADATGASGLHSRPDESPYRLRAIAQLAA